MATHENGGAMEALELLDNMRVLGVVPTIGRAFKGTDAPSDRRASYYLHKVPAPRVMALLGRVPTPVRAQFIRGFATHKQLVGARLPKDVELVYSQYDVGLKDRQLALVEYYGDERPDYLFLPAAHFRRRSAFQGRRGRKVGGPRGAARDPWGVVARMAAYRKRRQAAMLQRGPRVVGAIRNAFGTTRVMRARARHAAPPAASSAAAAGNPNAYAGHSALNRAAAAAYLRRARGQQPSQPAVLAGNRYVGPSTTTTEAASAFLARRQPMTPRAQRLNRRMRRAAAMR